MHNFNILNIFRCYFKISSHFLKFGLNCFNLRVRQAGKIFIVKNSTKMSTKYSQIILKDVFVRLNLWLIKIIKFNFLLQIFANLDDVFNFSRIFGSFY